MTLAGNRMMIAALPLALLGGCASANRDGAEALSSAGVSAATAISTEVNARADRIGDSIVTRNFNAAYATMRLCPAITITGTAATPEAAACDVISAADARRSAQVPQQLAELSRLVRLRGRAFDQLAAAYRALGAEADFDAQGTFETAISGATQSATELAGAVGLGPVPEVVGALARIGGGQLAANAQQRRLIAGSRQLQAVVVHLRAALEAERQLHQRADQVTDDIASEARRNLTMAGLAQPLPPLQEVVAASGFPSPGTSALQSALQASQRLTAASLVAGLAGRPSSADEALAASIAVLDTLIAKHQQFEARRAISLADLTAAVERLTEIVNAARGNTAADPAADAGAGQQAEPAGGQAAGQVQQEN